MKIGDSSISRIYLGDSEITDAYIGNDAIFHAVQDYLCFTANEASTITISGDYTPSLEYSLNKQTWSVLDSTVTISLATGDTAYLRGQNERLASSTSVYTTFVMTGSMAASGNIMSLLYPSGFSNKFVIPNTYCFFRLFFGCTALTSAPILPATSLKTGCYYRMFRGCTNLQEAPVLPALTSAVTCYREMFYSCTSLTSAPFLPIETLSANCYYQMFYNCTHLTYIKAMFTTEPSTSYTNNWVGKVASSGTFVMNSAAEWNVSDVRGVNGIPEGWTVETASS